jgi:hypothetical protein
MTIHGSGKPKKITHNSQRTTPHGRCVRHDLGSNGFEKQSFVATHPDNGVARSQSLRRPKSTAWSEPLQSFTTSSSTNQSRSGDMRHVTPHCLENFFIAVPRAS